MRVSQPATAALPWYLRPLFWLQKRRWGQVLVPALTWARVPSLYLALAGFYAAIERKGSPLDPSLRSLVQSRVSHWMIARSASISIPCFAERAGSLEKALAVPSGARMRSTARVRVLRLNTRKP